MSDTRPALTARWRELERRGWVFRIAQRTLTGNQYGLCDIATLEAYSPLREEVFSRMVIVPWAEVSEDADVSFYEQVQRGGRG